MDSEQRDRLVELAKFLNILDVPLVPKNKVKQDAQDWDEILIFGKPQGFSMYECAMHTQEHECRTAACALGWGIWLYKDKVSRDWSTVKVNEELYGLDFWSNGWDWMFSSEWTDTPWDSAQDAARRILWWLLGHWDAALDVLSMDRVSGWDELLKAASTPQALEGLSRGQEEA